MNVIKQFDCVTSETVTTKLHAPENKCSLCSWSSSPASVYVFQLTCEESRDYLLITVIKITVFLSSFNTEIEKHTLLLTNNCICRNVLQTSEYKLKKIM